MSTDFLLTRRYRVKWVVGLKGYSHISSCCILCGYAYRLLSFEWGLLITGWNCYGYEYFKSAIIIKFCSGKSWCHGSRNNLNGLCIWWDSLAPLLSLSIHSLVESFFAPILLLEYFSTSEKQANFKSTHSWSCLFLVLVKTIVFTSVIRPY